jgi:hypothetical protein
MYYRLQVDYLVEPEAYSSSLLSDIWGCQVPDFLLGEPLDDPGEVLRVELWEREGRALAEFFDDSVPLLRDDVIDTLRTAGVDNLQTLPVELVLREGGKSVPGYQAVNVVGILRAADLKKSKYESASKDLTFNVYFDKLVIDEEKANGQLFFRLAESCSTLVVHDSVKAALDAKNYKYLKWTALA